MKHVEMKVSLLAVLVVTSLLGACSRQETENVTTLTGTGEGIQVTDGWARPGAEGMNSAVYFLIQNFESTSDSLLSVTSDVAGMVQVHESYEAGEGMAGMRSAGVVEIPAESALQFEPGGLHVMLMQLNSPLSENDQFNLELTFKQGGTLTVPVSVELR